MQTKIKRGDRVFIVLDLLAFAITHCGPGAYVRPEVEGEPEGVVDRFLPGQHPPGTNPYDYARLTDGRMLPLRWLCLDPQGHVFGTGMAVVGEPNLCLACGLAITLPNPDRAVPDYSSDQEAERG